MNHPKRQLLILGALVILAFYGALAFGTKTLTPAEIWHGFLARDFDIWQYRLPRAILAIYIGAALALSGTIIQGIIHNPLASPDILGINHGASLAAVLTLTFISNLPLWALPLAACLGAAAAFAILLAFTRKNTGPLQMALIGVALSALYAAIADYLLLTWPQNLNTAMVWLTGSLWNRSWVFVQIAVPVLTLLLPLAFFATKKRRPSASACVRSATCSWRWPSSSPPLPSPSQGPSPSSASSRRIWHANSSAAATSSSCPPHCSPARSSCK